jgi:lipoprotein-anchoring transpeptidase ErfK/SrfK
MFSAFASFAAIPWRRGLAALALPVVFLCLGGCAGDTRHVILIGANDQRLVVLDHGKKVASYPVSTSKYGFGDGFGSYRTPMGLMKVRKKIGDNVPPGGVLKSRRFTGEVLAVDAPGRDPIVTRILWLQGLESENKHAYDRCIYIHGTPEERNIGTPASFGCIRMKSEDVIQLYDLVGEGARVRVVTSLPPTL